MRVFLNVLRSKLVIVVLAAAGLATFALGFWGWGEALAGTGATKLDIWFLTLRAFVFGDEYSGLDLSLFGEEVRLNCKLEAARSTGAVGELGTIMRAGFALFRAPLQGFAV
jgi:hypothetical protein